MRYRSATLSSNWPHVRRKDHIVKLPQQSPEAAVPAQRRPGLPPTLALPSASTSADFLDDGSAAGVDEEDASFSSAKRPGTEQMMGLRGQGAVNRDKVRSGQQLIQIYFVHAQGAMASASTKGS